MINVLYLFSVSYLLFLYVYITITIIKDMLYIIFYLNIIAF